MPSPPDSEVCQRSGGLSIVRLPPASDRQSDALAKCRRNSRPSIVRRPPLSVRRSNAIPTAPSSDGIVYLVFQSMFGLSLIRLWKSRRE